MRTHSIRGAVCAALTLAVSCAAAQEDADAPAYPGIPLQGGRGTYYFGFGLGAGTVTDDSAREFGLSADGKPYDTVGTIDYETGVSVAALFGYNLSDNLAAEIELTGRVNDFDGNVGDTDYAVSAAMAGLVLKAPMGRVEPYLGAGVGVVASNLESAGSAFGYQVKGGARLLFGAYHAVGAEVSFVGSGGFEVDDPRSGLEVGYAHVAYMLTYRLTGSFF